jgi:hypothetical protein
MGKILSVFLVLGIATPALALDRVGVLMQQSPNATPYQILEQLFNESSSIISFQDIDLPTQKCASVHATDAQPSKSALNIGKSFKTVAPGTPDFPGTGPLFPPKPGVPAQIVSKYLVARFAEGAEQKTFDSFYDYITTTITQTEIDSEVGPSDLQWKYLGPYSTRVRKNGTLLSFMNRNRIGSKDETKVYGYCWQAN